MTITDIIAVIAASFAGTFLAEAFNSWRIARRNKRIMDALFDGHMAEVRDIDGGEDETK